MTALDKLADHLANLDKGTSPRRARATGFVRFTDRSERKQVRLKLQGLQSSALGSFDEADAKMLEALWDNRDAILEALADIVRRDEPSEGYPSDLAASLNSEPRPMTGFFAGLTDSQKVDALAYRGEDCPTRENPCAEILIDPSPTETPFAWMHGRNDLVEQIPTSSLSQALSGELRGND
jgi:hypothetical protein